MEPGIYYDLSHEDYHKTEALSRGRLSQFKRSPKHMRYYLDHPEDRNSDAFLLGEFFHAGILEVDTLPDRFGPEPEVNKRTIAGRQVIADLKESSPKKSYLPPKLWELGIRLIEEVTTHGTIPSLLRPCKKEVSLFWEKDDVLCKARLDAYDAEKGIIYDLKTCQDASERGFYRTVLEHDYQMQAYWYLEGAKALGLKAEKFIWIPIEKKPPYCVSIIECGEGLLRDGGADIEKYFSRYVYCLKNNYWPGYSEYPVVLDKGTSYELN